MPAEHDPEERTRRTTVADFDDLDGDPATGVTRTVTFDDGPDRPADGSPGPVHTVELDGLDEPAPIVPSVSGVDGFGGPALDDVPPVPVVSFDDVGARPGSRSRSRRVPDGVSGRASHRDTAALRDTATIEAHDPVTAGRRDPDTAGRRDMGTAAPHDTAIAGPHDAATAEPDDAAVETRDSAGTVERRGSRGDRTGRRAERRPPGRDIPQDDASRAREICLRLLTDRARTVKELSDALRRKEIPDDVARQVLDRFDEVGLVDDEAFAGQWVRSRHHHKGLGRRAIAAELHRKGVDKEIADTALTEIDAESEEARARDLVDRKLRTMRVGTKHERASTARRLVGMLARKGYGGGVAYGVVREAIAARGAEEDELGEPPPDG